MLIRILAYPGAMDLPGIWAIYLGGAASGGWPAGMKSAGATVPSRLTTTSLITRWCRQDPAQRALSEERREPGGQQPGA